MQRAMHIYLSLHLTHVYGNYLFIYNVKGRIAGSDYKVNFCVLAIFLNFCSKSFLEICFFAYVSEP